jgi:hypothetical protein
LINIVHHNIIVLYNKGLFKEIKHKIEGKAPRTGVLLADFRQKMDGGMEFPQEKSLFGYAWTVSIVRKAGKLLIK